MLAQTTGSQWGQSFSYDGFGNLTSEQATKGTAYSANFNYNATTNRITTAGYQYDANGNLTAMPNAGMSYDIENRLAQATQTVNGTELYGYGLGNRRVWKQLADGSQEVYFYGPGGEKLGTYTLSSGAYPYFQEEKTDVYFRQQLIWEGPLGSGTGTGGALVLDRQGTAVVKDGKTYAYFPYGEPRVGTGDHYATYQRDATTGFDYALNRYYSNVAGRFLTPDPSSTAYLDNPQSWNQYAYASNDPINLTDPSGLDIWWNGPDDGGDGGGDDGGDPWGTGPSGIPFGVVITGGGGYFRVAQVDAGTTQYAHKQLADRLKNFGDSNCAHVLRRVLGDSTYQTSDLRSWAQNTLFYNFIDPKYGNLPVSAIWDIKSTNTMYPPPGGADAYVFNTSPLKYSPIAINGSEFYKMSKKFTENALLHELLHSYLRQFIKKVPALGDAGDAGMFNAFKKYGLTNTMGTESISAWLSTDCRYTPTNLTWYQ